MLRVGVQRKKGGKKGNAGIEAGLFLFQPAIEHERDHRKIGEEMTADDGTVMAVYEKDEKTVNFRNDPVSGLFFGYIK